MHRYRSPLTVIQGRKAPDTRTVHGVHAGSCDEYGSTQAYSLCGELVWPFPYLFRPYEATPCRACTLALALARQRTAVVPPTVEIPEYDEQKRSTATPAVLNDSQLDHVG